MIFFVSSLVFFRPKPCNVFPLATLNIDKTGRSWGPTMQLATQWCDQSDDPPWFVDDFGCHHWYSDIMVILVLSCIYHMYIYIYISCIIITWSAIYVCYWHLLTSSDHDMLWFSPQTSFLTSEVISMWDGEQGGLPEIGLCDRIYAPRTKKNGFWRDQNMVIQICSWILKGYNSGY